MYYHDFIFSQMLTQYLRKKGVYDEQASDVKLNKFKGNIIAENSSKPLKNLHNIIVHHKKRFFKMGYNKIEVPLRTCIQNYIINEVKIKD